MQHIQQVSQLAPRALGSFGSAEICPDFQAKSKETQHFESIKHLSKQERTHLAIQELKLNGKRASKITATRWGVARSTLFDKTSGRDRRQTCGRPEVVTTVIEATFVDELKSHWQSGSPLNKKQAFDLLTQLVAQSLNKTPSKTSIYRWFQFRGEGARTYLKDGAADTPSGKTSPSPPHSAAEAATAQQTPDEGSLSENIRLLYPQKAQVRQS
eukprot:TRINITY_DN2814_c0_g1_i1.p1 TRINITY_DN2814_c0_g1~~TRINITY_DN2814_c0_g1_i1.p1  ORF type:complete len:233 (+),score=53.26 TRINITY_DN2814_c0_g1_i1:62-700(+)